MAGKEMQMGTLSRTVAANVKRLREDRNWNLRDLASEVRRLAKWEIGGGVGVRRIEAEERRVSPDDLAALALALGVSPLALMLPVEDAELFPDGEIYAVSSLWEWAKGQRALVGDELDFIRASNPLEWPRMQKLIDHLGIGRNRQLAARILSNQASTAMAYEPAPEINADSDEGRALIREYEVQEARRRGDS